MAKTRGRRRRSRKKTLGWLIGIAAVLFVLIQFVPYGRTSHTDPPASNPFQWTDPKAKAIAKRSCYDCHSNETKWWWATKIAPFSWLVQHDVDGGRARLNFSDFSGMPPAAYFARSITDGRMPKVQYTLIHRNARLTDAEKRILIDGYRAGLAASGGQASATPSAAPASGDALAIVNSQCGTCHQAPVGLHAGSAAEAQALIENMVRQGAQVTPEQEQVLIQYFTQ
jgi:cytochrome c5